MSGTSGFIAPHDLASEASSPSPVARFGLFELDLRSGELRRSGIRVPLQDQPFRLLALLLEHAGEVVTREQLRERLWPSEFVDFDHSLNTAVRKLRAALDDDADNPRFIETLARRGYRFIAPVTWRDATARPARGTRRLLLAVVLVALALAAIVTTIVLRPQQQGPTIWSVAIMPFVNSDPATAHLSDGLTEILIDSLSSIPGMRVMARTTVFRYKNQPIDVKRTARELDVGALVIGDVRREGDGYRIHVELVDGRDGRQVWGDRFQVARIDLPAVHTRIAEDLARNLRHERRGGVTVSNNAEAYELYLKGLYAWNRRGRDDLQRAEEYFEQAARLDPGFAAAYAGLSKTYGVMVGYGLLSTDEGVPKVMGAARKTLELDPQNAEAFISLATTKYRNLWDFDGAERDYRRALELNPNYATGHQWYSDYLRSMGRFAEARREIDTAYKLDPLSNPINGAMCWSYFHERRYHEAIAFSRKAEELDPQLASPLCVMNAQVALGDFDQAVIEARKATNRLNLPSDATSPLDARRFFQVQLKILMAGPEAQWRFPIEIAETQARLGNRAEAFRWLEIAYSRRVSRLTSFHLHPGFDAIRDDPRFDDLLRRIGLPKVAVPGP